MSLPALAAALLAVSAGARHHGNGVDGAVTFPGGTVPTGFRWRSFGDTVVITDSSGRERALPWTEVDQALGGAG